jgi:hypothetical protein
VTEPLLAPLKFAFPNDYPEMIELAFARCLGRGELNKAGRCWKPDFDRTMQNCC